MKKNFITHKKILSHTKKILQSGSLRPRTFYKKNLIKKKNFNINKKKIL